MQLSSKELQFIVGSADVVERMPALAPMQPFSEEVLSFFGSLSKVLLRTGKEYSDVATFAFWCRRAALVKEKAKYDDLVYRFGKGIVFHSTPSNVPVNFAFSFAAGLLAGNANIVRLPAKDFAQVRIICQAINKLLTGEHKNIAQYIAMVKYPPVKTITDVFASMCDCRVVWGGDGTIAEMRQSPLKPRGNEINFADRHSIAVIDADAYLAAKDKEKIAQDFYNDTFFSDQNACTAPRLIVWLGKDKEAAKEEFWNRIHEMVREQYKLAPVQAVGKLMALDRVASAMPVQLIKNDDNRDDNSSDNLIYRVKVAELTSELMRYKYNSGFFFEYDAVLIDEILPVCDERCQTMTYYGLNRDQLSDFFVRCRPHGVDRAVPMGKSMDFTLVWDGHDLIREMSRRVVIL